MSDASKPIVGAPECVTDDHTFVPAYDWRLDPEVGYEGDPDGKSLRMRHYHPHLWSMRPLSGQPGGPCLMLKPRGTGLMDTALDQDFFGQGSGLYLSSDRTMATWWRWRETEELRQDSALMGRILQANPVLDGMGGTMLWPGWEVNGGTINQARGFGAERLRIADRLDLTVECIRLFYAKVRDQERNPLGLTFVRYEQFFDLFDGFDEFVDFWLLRDLLSDDGERVVFLMEGDIPEYDFTTRRPFPTSETEYDRYLDNALEFVGRRNDRMTAVWSALDLPS